MVACSFGINGHVVTVLLKNRKTVNSEWYTSICLPEVFEEERTTDNAESFFIVTLLSHDSRNNLIFGRSRDRIDGSSAVQPRFGTNDFYLFQSVKNKLCGQRVSGRQELVDVFKMHVLEIPSSEWKKCYKNWFQELFSQLRCIASRENNKTTHSSYLSRTRQGRRTLRDVGARAPRVSRP
ncbi:hypothetical protein EVAR_99125_1 [Eumeta japonica]|uniref:Uncharacterized protein n=1 Tax=Eumeta variegata TaxID=151549 RepID=A0A4C1YMT8_EUMVA|nr:hypothetical protein EVAR_99125_1 [Eumeta japonica]